jgi:plastocyanin
MKRLVPIVGSVVAGVLTGCSSGSQNAAAPVQPAVGPQSWSVVAGASTGNQAFQALAFYPNTITIDAGDTITWTAKPVEPHTISFPLPGATPVPPTSPSAQAPAGGTTFDGTTYVSSGFIGGGATYSLTFTKPGTYTYYSLPQQPIVSGTVVVQAAGTAYPISASAVVANGAAGVDADFTNAEQSVATIPYSAGSNSIAAGVSPATKGGATSSVMRFLYGPKAVDKLLTTIHVGTTLTFKNLSNNVPHTVTIPAAGSQPPAGPPFQAPSGGNTYDGKSLVNSGPLAPGITFAVKFTAVGTFPFYCLFHDGPEGMEGTITVIP